MKNERFKRALARSLWAVLGRKRLVRLGRFLSNAGRFDDVDGIEQNGEAMVPEAVLAHADRPALQVFDVGAFRGWWTESLLRLAGPRRSDLEIYLFEPSQRNHARLREILAGVPEGAKLHLLNLGVSDTEGEADFFVAGSGGTDSLYRHHLLAPDVAIERVEFTTVDRFCRDQGLERVTLLKTDAEGHDLKVLRGAQRMLREQRIEVLQFEYNHMWVLGRGYLRDAFELLQDCGYRVGKVTPRGVEFYEGWHWELETFRLANFLGCLPAWEPRFPRIRWWKDV
jgi:FkbM family methyltransferase